MPISIVALFATRKRSAVSESALRAGKPCVIYEFMDVDREIVKWIKARLAGAGLNDNFLLDSGALSCDKGSVSKKLNCQVKFSSREQYKIARALGASMAEMWAEIEARAEPPDPGRAQWDAAYVASDPEARDAALKLLLQQPPRRKRRAS